MAAEEASEPSEDIERWDFIARRYTELAETRGTSSFNELLSFIPDRCASVSRGVALDVGCGSGWLAYQLSRPDVPVVGLEGSTTMIELGRERYPGLTLIEQDLNRGLGAEAASFDVTLIYSRFALQCIEEPTRLIEDAAELIAPGAHFCVTLPHPVFYGMPRVEAPDGRHYRKVTGYLDADTRWLTDFGGHRYFHRSIEWYISQFTSAGFALVDFAEQEQRPPHRRDDPVDQWTGFERWWLEIPVFLGMDFVRL